jgi:undecaprenyl-diphosphatase
MGYTHYISDLLRYIEAIAVLGGYPFLFLTVLLEGVPLLGALVPGHVSIIVAGFLIKVGVFNPWFTIVLAIIAATLGDYIGYRVGKKYGLSLIDRISPYFFISKEQIERIQNLLEKHLGKSMILGRFSPITRALMPFVVGVNHAEGKKTKEKRFWVFNIIGGSVWVISSLALGYVFGAGYEAASGFTGKFVLIAIGAAVLIAWGYRFVNRRFHIFKKYELFVLAINIVSLWGLAATIQNLWINSPVSINFDETVNIFMASHVNHLMGQVASLVSAIGGTVSIGAISMIGIVMLFYRKKWRSASILFLSISSTGVMFVFLKEFFMRTRPENALQYLTDPSFPSGHAAIAAAFFLVLAYLLIPRIHSWIKRELFVVLCVVLAITVGLSRVVLNVHWSSDVIAGWSLGMFCATSSILFVRYVGGILHKQIIEGPKK